jgi:toxin ParE1/3/4
MTRCLLRPRAQRDLNAIWNHSVASWSVNQAETYIREIQRVCAMLAEDPRLGRPCEDIRAGYRKFRAGSHFVFYRIIEDGIDVVRVLHERMDFEQHL